MKAKLIPCGQIAEDILSSIKDGVFYNNANPSLSIYSNPEDIAGKKYVENKLNAAAKCGINAIEINTDSFETANDLITTIKQDNSTGIIIQKPMLPRFKSDEHNIIMAIPSTKDVDGLTPCSPFIPATPLGISRILDWVAADKGISNHYPWTNCVIVGRSELVGRPLARLLARTTDATITLCNSKTKDLSLYTRYADILITACGVPGRITEDMLSPGCTLIDVGTTFVDGKLKGDATKECDEVCGYIARIGKQGGVGRTTVSGLMENIWRSYLCNN